MQRSLGRTGRHAATEHHAGLGISRSHAKRLERENCGKVATRQVNSISASRLQSVSRARGAERGAGKMAEKTGRPRAAAEPRQGGAATGRPRPAPRRTRASQRSPTRRRSIARKARGRMQGGRPRRASAPSPERHATARAAARDGKPCGAPAPDEPMTPRTARRGRPRHRARARSARRGGAHPSRRAQGNSEPSSSSRAVCSQPSTWTTLTGQASGPWGQPATNSVTAASLPPGNSASPT